MTKRTETSLPTLFPYYKVEGKLLSRKGNITSFFLIYTKKRT